MLRSSSVSIRVYHCDETQMEEQTVPSAGFSPQPEYMGGTDSSSYYGNSVGHLQLPQHQMHHQQQHQQNQATASAPLGGGNVPCYDYNTSFDTFDLSLLGDYEDRDMATVPSPSASCWSPHGGAMESTIWPASLYPTSPPEFRAFSPDCKPFNSPAEGNMNHLQCNNNNSSNAATPQPQVLDNSSNTGAAALSNGNNNSDDANNHAHHQQQPHNNGNNATNILLRQYLEDNTFIEKYKIQPMDFPITALPSSNEAAGVVESSMENGSNGGARVPTGPTDAVGSATLDMNLEPVFSLAYETIISDIQNHCRTLGISPDPMQWSVENVQSWLALYISEKRSGSAAGVDASVLRSLWSIDGHQLCALSEQEFRQRDPLNGEKIYANLELLKMWKCTDSSTSSSSSGPQPFDFGQLLNICSPSSSVGAASPAPSCAQDEQQSPAVAAGVTIKVELDENMQPITPLSQAKFSNPGSVDTASSTSSLRNSDDDDEEDEEDDKTSSATTSVVGTKKACGTKNGAHIHLWQFLKELLASGQQHGSCIRWLDQSRGVFKIEDSVRVARLWGIRKNRPAMNYDKLSRSIRQYYRKGIMRKTERSQRLVYQFCHPYGL